MNYSNEIEALPDPLRQTISTYHEDEDHASVAAALSEYVSGGGSPTAELLVALACATFLNALEVMVDDLIPSSERSLALLQEALALPNADAQRIASLRRKVQKVLTDAITDDRVDAHTSRSAIEQGIATADHLGDQAYRALKKGQLGAAAQLFLRAATQETSEASGRSVHAKPDQTINYIARAGKCLAEDAYFASAEPLLQRVIDFDWRLGRLWADRHVVEWAFACVLYQRAREGDWSSFERTWHQALRRCAELDMAFPFIHPIQERLLALCMGHRQAAYLPRLISQIEARSSRLSKPLRESLAQAKALIVTTRL